MRSESEVLALLGRFNGLEHEDIEDTPAEGIYAVLLWFQGHWTDEDVTRHIPELD
jgi:hypothetical protein